jgi:glycine C-acetyltransferase/8-amino-7-oxononanoate synthase
MRALEICERALSRGIFAQAIRPPTVPDGGSRLRLAAMATHTPAELAWAAEQLADAAHEAGAAPSGTSELFLYDAELDEPVFERAA